MRIGMIVKRSAGNPPVMDTIEVPLPTILAFIVGAGGFSALASLLTVFFVNWPNTKAEVETKRANVEKTRYEMTMESLETALQLDSAEDRRVSLQLLMHAGVLDSAGLAPFVRKTQTIPHWPATGQDDGTPP